MKSIHKLAMMAAMMAVVNPTKNNFKVAAERSKESQIWKRKKCKSCAYLRRGSYYCGMGKHVKPTFKACNQWKGK